MRARPVFVWWVAVVVFTACGGDDEGGAGRDSGGRDLGSAPADATMDAPAPTDAADDSGADGGSGAESGPAIDADGMLDSEVADSAGGDSGAVDGGPDSGPVDSSVVDSSVFDAGVGDAGPADAGCAVPCGATCCAPGFVCGPSTGRCLAPCASGRPFCGLGDECCADESICEPITGTCAMECAPSVPPCGDVCCDSEAFCDESSVSCVAACAPGRACGPRCCAPGAVCDADTTTCTDACPPDRRCGDICCPSDEQCGPSTRTCLPRCASGLWCGPTDLCCGARDLCRFSACLPDLGTCATDAECLTDSYCDGGLCTPYGFGPRGSSAPMCSRVIPLGLFSPTIQCEWPGPPAGDPFPSHGNVLVTPAVVDLDMDVDPLTLLPSIVVTSYNGEDGGSGACTGDGTFFGVIRILDGNTCAQQHTLSAVPVIGSGNPAVGDLDGDGRPEIVAPAVGGGVAIYRFDVLTRTWSGRRATNAGGTPSTWGSSQCNWAGVSIADLDDDGRGEILHSGFVYSSLGVELGAGPGWLTVAGTGQIPVSADVDLDGLPELVTGSRVYRFDAAGGGWVPEAYSPAGLSDGYVAIADFGPFEPTVGMPDVGYPEIVVVAGGQVQVRTIHGRTVFGPIALPTPPGGACGPGVGGPPTVADFDGDGVREIAVAGGVAYAIFDLFDCPGPVAPAGCYGPGIRWARLSQDCSSNRTGSSIFDFEADGRAEAVYADECYARVYDGVTGDVLFSQAHTSCTWYENVVVADSDGDYRSEMVVPSNTNCVITCPTVDPVHPGLRCAVDTDCPTRTGCVMGYCRCTGAADCPAGGGFACAAPLPGTPGAGNVCRASHPGEIRGVRVYRDVMDRWVNSRPVWNQHAYAVTNVGDTGAIPRTSAVVRNWQTPGLNNFRQNVQGTLDPLASGDLTARGGTVLPCVMGRAPLEAAICNRGTAPLAGGLPVAFYIGDPRAGGTLACTTAIVATIRPGECAVATCEVTLPSGMPVDVWVRADDDGTGMGTASECVEENNLGTFRDVMCSGPS